ncbi:MAG TPA: hypothetical protein PK569_20355, partial [Thermoanaerobaculia bacterium]|nr:hypothetical protein [Thermoanaerobaculia bacterium]
MVLDTTKKPIGQTAGGTTEGGTARKKLDLTKKPIAASGSPESPAALAEGGRKDDRPARATRLAWLLAAVAAVAAVVGLGFLALPHIGGKAPEAGSDGASTEAASRELAGETPGSNPTGAVVPAVPVSEVDTGTAGGSSAGGRTETDGAMAERSIANAAAGGDIQPSAEPGREATTDGRAGNLAGGPSAGAGHIQAGTTAGGRDVGDKAAASSDRGGASVEPPKAGTVVPKPEPRGASGGSRSDAEGAASRANEGGRGRPIGHPQRPPVATTNPASVLLTVQFGLNSAAMSPEEEVRIRSEVGDTAAKAPRGLVVEGFTCSLGTEEFNDDLARRRADAVA